MTAMEKYAPDPRDLALDYDTRSWPRGQAFEFDREALSSTYDLTRPAGTEGHWFKSQISLVGSLMLARNHGGGGHILIRSDRHIESNSGYYLKMQLFSGSGGYLAIRDRILALDPGAVFLIDQSRPYRQTMPSGQNLTFFLPHALVNYDPANMPAFLSFGPGTAEGRFLSHAMRMLFRLAGGRPSSDESGLDRAFCGSVAGILDWYAAQTRKSSPSQTRRIEAVRRQIDVNFADPEFGPEDILAKVTASRATIYRDFAPMGGLMAYIHSRRLEMAYHILSMSPRHRGAVSAAAERSGFKSAARFSQAFQSQYRSAPSDILGQWRISKEESHRSDGCSHSAQTDALRAVYTWPAATSAFGRHWLRTDIHR
jgi:AraC-like DNA-binding protein